MVKSLEGEIMLSDDVLRLHEGGQRCACPYPAFKQGWIAAELIRLERFVLCAPTVLQAGPGAGGHRPWAVSRSDKNRLASIRVAIFRAAVARATRSTGRDGGRRCSIVRFVNCETEARYLCFGRLVRAGGAWCYRCCEVSRAGSHLVHCSVNRFAKARVGWLQYHCDYGCCHCVQTNFYDSQR